MRELRTRFNAWANYWGEAILPDAEFVYMCAVAIGAVLVYLFLFG